MSILFNVWMLPILFILHDFEEMIFMPLWKKRHHQKLMTFKKPFFGSVTQGSAFAVGVLEEFIILLFISGLCQMTHNTLLYLSFVIAYTSHFTIHYIMCLRFKGYVPGVVTASLELPVVLMIVFRYWPSDISLLPVIVYLFIAMAIAYTNLKIMHQIMPKIQLSLEKYMK
ncbi:HXXEE domain-containing protein [Streptococcus troglodytae]|uniref:Membrane protein n=1 Tax=Streptococcus troglodytae TaxID=1111760 RepID=A0A1L7LGJ2_9STRE|nr:HXXEE domain-containing protein [Streptococcus troglodytae]BAQ23311.1 membrane protein [Streptococcus troglodytae]